MPLGVTTETCLKAGQLGHERLPVARQQFVVRGHRFSEKFLQDLDLPSQLAFFKTLFKALR